MFSKVKAKEISYGNFKNFNRDNFKRSNRPDVFCNKSLEGEKLIQVEVFERSLK